MKKATSVTVQNTAINLKRVNSADYLSLTDIARHKDAERSDYILQNWMRNKSTIEFLGLWEKINNEEFNYVEFDGIKNQAGSNSFTLSPTKWIENKPGLVAT